MSTQPQPDNTNELTIQDLALMKGIIDLASERSAFKPAEMAAVGTIYNKLTNFLKVVEEQSKAAQEAQAAQAAQVEDAAPESVEE
tara:strand:+ start:612 stop:866 length:255 start_codon:yes stop_codon:yes gene_type:complete